MDEDLLTAVARHLSGREGLVAAYVFGSRARGEDRAGSDLDLAVLFTDPLPARLGGPLDTMGAQLDRELGIAVDVVDLARAPADLIHRVLRDGVLVWEGDRSRRISFEVHARNEYFDLLPYLREYRRRGAA